MFVCFFRLQFPEYFYAFSVGVYQPKVFFDVAEGKTEIAKEFIEQRFPDEVSKDLVYFTEQEPFLMCMDQQKLTAKGHGGAANRSNSPLSPNSMFDSVQPGSKIMKICPHLKDAILADKDLFYLDLVNHRYYDYTSSFGSIGAFARDQDGNFYMVTASHVLKTEMKKPDDKTGASNDYRSQPVHGVFSESLHVISEFRSKEDEMPKIIHLGDEYQGALLVEENKKAIDIAAVKLQDGCEKVNIFTVPQNESLEKVTIKTFRGTDKDLLGQKVQKCGYKTGFTSGVVCLTNRRLIIGDKATIGCFMVEADEKFPKFADQGDSGALVVSLDTEDGSAMAYGIVFSQNKYVDYDQPKGSGPKVYDNLLTCIRIDHNLEFLEKTFGLKLTWCTAQLSDMQPVDIKIKNGESSDYVTSSAKKNVQEGSLLNVL